MGRGAPCTGTWAQACPDRGLPASRWLEPWNTPSRHQEVLPAVGRVRKDRAVTSWLGSPTGALADLWASRHRQVEGRFVLSTLGEVPGMGTKGQAGPRDLGSHCAPGSKPPTSPPARPHPHPHPHGPTVLQPHHLSVPVAPPFSIWDHCPHSYKHPPCRQDPVVASSTR